MQANTMSNLEFLVKHQKYTTVYMYAPELDRSYCLTPNDLNAAAYQKTGVMRAISLWLISCFEHCSKDLPSKNGSRGELSVVISTSRLDKEVLNNAVILAEKLNNDNELVKVAKVSADSFNKTSSPLAAKITVCEGNAVDPYSLQLAREAAVKKMAQGKMGPSSAS